MSISNQTNKVFGTGTGSVYTFSFLFKIFSATELQVYLIDPTGASTLLTLTTDYSVSINPASEGGTVTFVVAPPANYQTFIKRVEPYTQSLVLATEGPLPAKQIENQLDLAMMTIIQLQEQVSRTIQLPVVTQLGQIVLPIPVAGGVLGWDPSLTTLINVVPNTGAYLPPLSIDGTMAANSDALIPSQKAVKTYAVPLTAISIDGTMAANSDALIPSQKAVQTYTDNKNNCGHITILPWDYNAISGGLLYEPDTAQVFANNAYNSDQTQNNYFDFTVELEAGTWSFRAITATNNDSGILSLIINGTTIDTKDTYSNPKVRNVMWTKTGIIISKGRQTIRIQAATKNGSSSAYTIRLSSLALWRTA